MGKFSVWIVLPERWGADPPTLIAKVAIGQNAPPARREGFAVTCPFAPAGPRLPAPLWPFGSADTGSQDWHPTRGVPGPAPTPASAAHGQRVYARWPCIRLQAEVRPGMVSRRHIPRAISTPAPTAPLVTPPRTGPGALVGAPAHGDPARQGRCIPTVRGPGPPRPIKSRARDLRLPLPRQRGHTRALSQP